MLGSRHIAPGQLAAYIDAELSPEEEKSVEAHLVNCQRCYAKAMQQGQAKRLLHDVTNESDEQKQAENHISSDRHLTLRNQLWQESSYETGRRRPALLVLIAVAALMLSAVYGIQSLVTDVFTRDRSAENSRTAIYVEDHLNFADTYQVAN